MKAKQPAVEACACSASGSVFREDTSCSPPAVPAAQRRTSVRVQDYEQDILGFLRGRHGTDSPTIVDLLTGVARGGAQTDLAMLADLERSIDSFESLHRGGGGS